MNSAANHCPLPKFAVWSLALDSVRQMFRPLGPLFPRPPVRPPALATAFTPKAIS